MATVKAKKTAKVKTAKVRKVQSDESKRRKPFPALPKNEAGELLNKYTSALTVGKNESLPPETMFVDWFHWAETAADYYARRAEQAEALALRLGKMTPEEREAERTGVKAVTKAEKEVENPLVQKLFMEKVKENPSLLLEGLKDANSIMAMQAQLQAALMAMETKTVS